MFVKCSGDPGTGDPGAPDEPRRKLTGRGGERGQSAGTWDSWKGRAGEGTGQGRRELEGKVRPDPTVTRGVRAPDCLPPQLRPTPRATHVQAQMPFPNSGPSHLPAPPRDHLQRKSRPLLPLGRKASGARVEASPRGRLLPTPAGSPTSTWANI